MSKTVDLGALKLSRRNLLQAAAAAGVMPVVAMTSQPAAAKIAQATVTYQDSPKGENKCGNCNLFVAPDQCKTVDGTVSENGWCKIWTKKVG